MPALPKAVVVGHRKWKVRESRSTRRDGLCDYDKVTLFVRLQGQTGPQRANTLIHEINHAAFHEGGLSADDTEERIVSVLSNIWTQVFRDNPDVIDWIAEKARG